MNINKKQIFANLINISILMSILGLLFSHNLSFWFLFILIILSIISLFLFDFKNKKIYFLIFVSIISIFLLSYFNLKTVKENISDSVEVENIKQESVENMLQNLEIKIKNNESQQNLLEYLNYMINISTQKLSTSTPKSYLDLAKVYEAGYITNLLPNKGNVLNNYYNYCKLEPNDPECYASIARFMALDRSQKDDALKFANRALELARNEQEISSYNALVEYIIKL